MKQSSESLVIQQNLISICNPTKPRNLVTLINKQINNLLNLKSKIAIFLKYDLKTNTKTLKIKNN